MVVDDEQLAGKASRGDPEALSELIQRYRRWIYTVAYKVVLHEQDARDITQNVFFKLVSVIRSYRAPGNFRAWLTVLTTNAAIDFTRQAVRRETPTEADRLEELADGLSHRPPNPREALEAKTRLQSVEKALMELTPQQRAILGLQLAEDLPPREIAERLEIPPGQVRVQLCCAVAKLKIILRDAEKPHSLPEE